MQNWLPALLTKLINLPPEIPTWLFIYLQNVLLGFALFRYTRVVTGRIGVSWVTVFFALSALPWKWNLANYESVLYSPYPGQLALPFVIFSAVELIQNRFPLAVLFLILGGLIHPSLALHVVLFFMLFCLLQFRFQEYRNFLKRILLLCAVVAVCVGPQLFMWSKPSYKLPAADLMLAMRTNFHANPLIHDLFFAFRIPTFLGFVALTALAFRHHKRFTAKSLTFWISSLAGTVILVFLHVAGFAWEIPRFIQLIPLRGTLLWIIYSLPFVTTYLLEKVENDGFMAGWIAASILLLHAVFSFGLYWVPILAIFFIELSKRHISTLRLKISGQNVNFLTMSGQLLFLGWLGMVLAWGAVAALSGPQISSRPVFSILIPGVYISGEGFLFAILAAAGIGLSAYFLPDLLPRPTERNGTIFRIFSGIRTGLYRLIGKKRLYLLPTSILIMTLAGITMVKAYCTGEETRGPKARAIYEAQLWARDNTKQDSLFMLLGEIPWRTISQRPAVEIAYRYYYFIYSGSKSAKEFDDKMEAFWRREGISPKGLAGISPKDLDEPRIMRLAKLVGADYIVCWAENHFAFSEAYRNDRIIIYELPLL
ncbi:MAG: hypothetical protein ABH843_05435 [Candidatus Omnitrophota bacterium]